MYLLENTCFYKTLWKAIIRPRRQIYDVAQLGPESFIIHDLGGERYDYVLRNSRNQKIECSLFLPDSMEGRVTPCVVYLHGNCGSRIESKKLVRHVLARRMALFWFDFAGSGISEGEYVDLEYQKEDLMTAIKFLKEQPNIGKIGIYGFSMGASTWLLAEDLDKDVSWLVLDSPFASLRRLCVHHAIKRIRIPAMIAKYILGCIQKTVQEKANFDIKDIVPIKRAWNFKIPCHFIAGKNDSLIPISHSEAIYNEYGGTKRFTLVEGDHNSCRSDLVYNAVANFLAENLFRTSDQEQTPNESLSNTSCTFGKRTHNRTQSQGDIQPWLGDQQYISTPPPSTKNQNYFDQIILDSDNSFEETGTATTPNFVETGTALMTPKDHRIKVNFGDISEEPICTWSRI